MTTDIYQQVTDRIVASLEQGTAPWLKPWKDATGGASIDRGTLIWSWLPVSTVNRWVHAHGGLAD